MIKYKVIDVFVALKLIFLIVVYLIQVWNRGSMNLSANYSAVFNNRWTLSCLVRRLPSKLKLGECQTLLL